MSDERDKYYWAIQRGKSENQDPHIQEYLAPREHREFAHNFVEDNPIIGPLSLAVATPGYYVAKKLGFIESRTEPSIDQVFAGYEGIARGIRSNLGLENESEIPADGRDVGDLPKHMVRGNKGDELKDELNLGAASVDNVGVPSAEVPNVSALSVEDVPVAAAAQGNTPSLDVAMGNPNLSNAAVDDILNGGGASPFEQNYGQGVQVASIGDDLYLGDMSEMNDISANIVTPEVHIPAPQLELPAPVGGESLASPLADGIKDSAGDGGEDGGCLATLCPCCIDKDVDAEASGGCCGGGAHDENGPVDMGENESAGCFSSLCGGGGGANTADAEETNGGGCCSALCANVKGS